MENKGMKKGNIVQIVIVLVLLSWTSSWFTSFASFPVSMAKALFFGEMYTGTLTTSIDEYEQEVLGIYTENSADSPIFIRAERIGDITKEVFIDIEHTVFMDKEGNTFWLTYEDLFISYILLLILFVLFRVVFSLTMLAFNKLHAVDDLLYEKIRLGSKLLIKPIRLFLMGFILVKFYQYRTFGFEEELDYFYMFLIAFTIYLVFISIRRFVVLFKGLKTLQGEYNYTDFEKSTVKQPNYKEVDEHDNELIKREKVKYNHKTSRYD